MAAYVGDGALFDCRQEDWYRGYLNHHHKLINDIANHESFVRGNGQIKLLGIEGDVQYGKRTLSEWTFLSQDIDLGVRRGIIVCRPQMERVPLANLDEALSWVHNGRLGQVRRIIISSCPARIGQKTDVMQEVKAKARRFDNVHVAFSEAGDLVDVLFGGGGGVAGLTTSTIVSIRCTSGSVNGNAYLATPSVEKSTPCAIMGRAPGQYLLKLFMDEHASRALCSHDEVRIVSLEAACMGYDNLYIAESHWGYFMQKCSNEKQRWQLRKVGGRPRDPICSGDRVQFFLNHYPKYRMYNYGSHACGRYQEGNDIWELLAM
eukprot:TRINITY_DN45588_c0_g1_i1.p1 TRINITY_DN45588_c0_g1~~TRINITY_DN45588_c0_g1_i1.p1  ORF type:complete len:319 (-),score=25.91 TRINITY_DN45588_c0_g1_i1:121-1077(-)